MIAGGSSSRMCSGRRSPCASTTQPPWAREAIQAQRYFPGQQFKPHNDWFYTTEKYWQMERKRGGQRSWTAMVFLNEVEQGGETHFVNVGIKIQPKPGVLLVWNNALPDGSPNEGTLHAGTPVLAGIVHAGEVVTHMLTIDGVGASQFLVAWDVGGLDIRLVRPDGQQFDAVWLNAGVFGADSGAIIQMDAAPQLSDLVRMLNGLGATPQDLLAILQAIKAAGAMNAELEVI